MNQLHTDILILGAGIGGYETFRTLTKLLKRYGLRKKILVVDRNNYFTFTPMLHEVASGSVEPYHAAIPLRELMHCEEEAFLKADILKVLPKENRVVTSRGDISYEYCVVALGSGVNYYGIAGADTFCYNVRTLSQAVHLHGDLIKMLDSENNELSMVIVGGGYTGVEVAGQFSDLTKKHIAKLYPNKKVSITIVQNGATLVPELPPKAQTIISKRLEAMGVRLMLDNGVSEVQKNRVILKDGTALASDMTLWTAGIKNIGNAYFEESETTNGCLAITDHLNVIAFPNVYAVGDIATCLDDVGKRRYPPLGEFAHKEGQHAAYEIIARLRKTSYKPFSYRSYGTLMPIGDWFGLFIVNKKVFSGRLAWWIRRTVYLAFMPGFWRRVKIMVDWTLHIVGIRHIINVE